MKRKKNQKEYIKEAKSSWRVKGKGNISRGNKNTCIEGNNKWTPKPNFFHLTNL